MPVPRSQTIDPLVNQIIHVWSRVVRRSFLCGKDAVMGRNYEHRREWLQDRIEQLAEIYCIDVITFSIMHNHHHELLRTRADIVKTLSNEDAVRQWMKLNYDRYFFPDGRDRKSTKAEVRKRVNDPKQMKKIRRTLSNVSKFMQSLNQHIAVRANKEDNCSGKFFEQRFGHEVLADTPDVLACNLYIDLNPIHAQIASTPEESEYTGAYERINDLRMYLFEEEGRLTLNLSQSGSELHQWERLGAGASGWLSPLEIDQRTDPVGPDVATNHKRASNKGALPMPLLQYLGLLDAAGRRIRGDKKGSIPSNLPPILDRMGIAVDTLFQAVEELIGKHSSYFRKTERGGRPDQGRPDLAGEGLPSKPMGGANSAKDQPAPLPPQ